MSDLGMTESSDLVQTDYLSRPKGIGVNTYRNIVSAAETAFRVHAEDGNFTLPTLVEIQRLTAFSERTIVKVLSSKEFKNEMHRRGINWTENTRLKFALSPEMNYCIGVVTNPTD